MNSISPIFKDYELIDSGDFEKLERFGKHVISRPEPQALWEKNLSDQEWNKLAEAVFRKNKENSDRGEWVLKKGMPDKWWMFYDFGDRRIKLRLGLTAFKHVGIFPEQADNWLYIYNSIKRINGKSTLLNLFAYTGGASLAARAGGASVVHLDSVKQVITWARENMEESNLDGISWVVEDAHKFVKREVSRGKIYQGIVLDPPAYGRGPKGEKWILEDFLPELLMNCKKLLDRKYGFLVLNLYSMGLSPLIADSLLRSVFTAEPKSGELYFADRAGRKLPLGIYSRFAY